MINVKAFTPKDKFGSNAYLLSVDDEYAIIDPSVDYSTLSKQYPDIIGKIKYILLTHCHFDHILEINSWRDVCDKVIIGEGDALGLSDPHLNCYLGFLGIEAGYYGKYTAVKDGDILPIGQKKIRVISTPGHTPGCVCYRIDDVLFTGDTVFEKGGYGRCDLPGGDIDTLERSLIKLLTHEQDADVYPGHGSKTTIKDIVTFFI